MASQYKTFTNWENNDAEEFFFQKDNDREIDDPGLNQDDSKEKQEEDFDDSDDFHKHDDTDQEEEDKNASDSNQSGQFDGNITI